MKILSQNHVKRQQDSSNLLIIDCHDSNDSGGNHRTHGFEFAISPGCGSGENVGVESSYMTSLLLVCPVSIQTQSERLLEATVSRVLHVLP